MDKNNEVVKWILGYLILLIFLASSCSSLYEKQARFHNENGHLYVISAEDRNISLKTSGRGFINVNDEDLLAITSMARRSSELVDRLQISGVPALSGWEGSLIGRLRRLEAALALTNSSGIDSYKSINRQMRILNSRVTSLMRVVLRVRQLLAIDECESSPCQNGGTCTDLFNGFHCHCPPEWQGAMCELDVDECKDLAGTDLGCKNGATCRNSKGSYACTCTPGWFGLRCNERTYDCTARSSKDLCGHGVCVNQGGTGRGFACICDKGWTVNEGDGTCTLDKNECAGPHRPCSQDPFVECLNTPGSFTCGNCPRGYTGNGFHCIDIDECEINNGGCSVSPQVRCVNTRGSKRCGPCPPGYAGDGMSCTRSGKCAVDNGGCHQLASCQVNSALGYVECRCPPGYSGPGVGPNGCLPSSAPSAAVVCDSSPCQNGGTCVPVGGDRYMCKCKPLFTGANCSEQYNICSLSPCLNGGTCEMPRFTSVSSYYRCRCPDGYSGSRCENRVVGCVESYSDFSGNVSWPPANRTSWASYFTCAWRITTLNNKAINVTFTEVNLLSARSGSRCVLSFIEVYDGASSAGAELAHFCGPELPPPIISSSNSMFITAMLPHYRYSLKFNWTTIDPHCGGDLNATTHGSFSSPGSPGRYPQDAHCVWKLFTWPGQRIQLTFFAMDIEVHENCEFDYIEIRAGLSETGRMIRKLCNSTIPPPVIISDNEATVIFHSDSTGSGVGFQIAYNSFEGVPGCGGVYTAPRGEITPPLSAGGTGYREALNCQWLIELPPTERIQVSFSKFSIESDESCKYDKLEVYDGPTRDSGLIGRWCGEESITPFTSSGNALLVIFTSDNSLNEGNFVLNYVAVCGGRWTDREGVFSTPYYPDHYPEDRTCTFLIERPLGNAIKLRFTDFDMEESENCVFDKIQVYDGNSNHSSLIGEYCGKSSPGEIISTHNFLFLVLTTDISDHGRGFQANYTSIDITCGGIFTADTGTFSSPRYPENYPANQNCTWIISTKPGTVIRLTWLSFHVDKNYNCDGDYVQMYDNNTVQSLAGPLGGRYCGTNLPPAATTSSNRMSIVFHASSGNTQPGFTATYSTINSKEVCGANYLATVGVLNSPNYPRQYPHNLDCHWVISVPDGQQIELKPKFFSIDYYSTCHDYLEIRNGGHASSPLVNKFCGKNFDTPIISTTNKLFLRFVTDPFTSGEGFSLEWDGAKTGCGGTLTGSSGSIMSPNYPQSYGTNSECVWKISVARGSTIRLTLLDFDLEEMPSCSQDFLEIYDGGKRYSPIIARLCSERTQQLSYETTGNIMMLRFVSDFSVEQRGFHLKYQTVCNVTLKGYRGVIESPGFPTSELINQNCLWKIGAPIGNKINMTFSHFNLKDFSLVGAGHTICEKHSVKIYDGEVANSSLIDNYCSKNTPSRLISSTTNVVYVNFILDREDIWIEHSTFRIEWVVYGCGGAFRSQRSGELTSPNYPNPYPHSTVCEWFLSVLPGNSIVIKIDDLRIEESRECTYDALEVYGGPDDTSPRLAQMCNKVNGQSPSVVTTSGNNAFIRFRTDSSSTGVGFHATYSTTSSVCGGSFNSSSGSIHSHNYPQNYDANDDCTYTITVDEAHTVNLTFTDFEVDAIDSNCTNGYVKIYDGDTSDSPLLKTLCGKQVPPSIFSTQNSLFIRYKSDGFAVAKGFYATYQTACGSILSTDNRGIIKFEEVNSTLRWNSNFKCEWIIKSKLPDSKIRIQFALMELNSIDKIVKYNGTDDTSKNLLPGINILSGEGLDAPLFKTYYGKSIPAPITVPSSVATVVYVAHDDRLHNARFILDYSVLNTACGGSPISAESGTIVSPNYPDPYPNNVECVWTLLLAPGNKMDFLFKKFSLMESESCNEDYVELRSKDESGLLIGIYCGSTIPQRITVNETLWIKFKSGIKGSDTSYSGFEATFALGIENEVSGISGEIASPLYPLSYIQVQTFSWRIFVKNQHSIHITFTDFNIDSISSWRCINRLKIYDGYDKTGSLLKTLCGSSIPEPFSSENSVVYIVLVQIYQGWPSRFFMKWMQMEKVPPLKTSVSIGSNCTTFVELNRDTNASYTFKSPDFPNQYKNKEHCEWIFQCPLGDHIEIRFQSFSLESSYDCGTDSVTIYNGGLKDKSEEWVKSEKLCHDNSTEKIYNGTQLVKVVFKTDYSVTSSGFSATATSRCGGEINQPNGIISGGPFNLCQWNVTVKIGRTIKLTLEKFVVHDTQPCTVNYLILKDGGSADSPDLLHGKLCGDKVFNIPDTKSNRLYIQYRGRSTEGFLLKFEEKSHSCGETIMLDSIFNSTVISSPNYPHVPPPHVECIWQVTAPSDESIHFEVHDRFDMAYSKGCSEEYLELRDGSTEFGHLIGRYCIKTPSYITTEGNSLFVKYFTDRDVPNDGFKATVSITKCGGTIYTNYQNGTITSPGYPNSYEENLNCTWKLVTSSYHVFILNISYDLGLGDNNCDRSSQDTLNILDNLKDGFILKGSENKTFCGSASSIVVTSETNEVYINFLSRKQSIFDEKKFFKIDYFEKDKNCGGNLNLPSGVIMSPNYPNSNEQKTSCTWRITAPKGRRVTFSIYDLDLAEGSEEIDTHLLSFYEDHRYGIKIKSFTGSLSNVTVIESSGNKMMVHYRSFHSNTHKGFFGNYTTDQPALCGGIITTQQKHGILQVPENLLTKNGTFFCEWDFINPSTDDSTVTFSFEGTMYPPPYRFVDCTYTSSKLRITGKNSKLIGDFCSVTKPNSPFFISKPHDKSSVIASKFSWEKKDEFKEAKVPYSLKWKIDPCGGTLKVSAPMTIRSPGGINYPPDTDCVWLVSTIEGSRLKVHFSKFDLDSDCQEDYLKIHNGNSPRFPVMSLRCGTSLSKDLISQSNDIWIHFHSGSSKQKSGFVLEISQADSVCGGVINTKQGIIQSPGYPSTYPNNVECEWELQAPLGFHIGLSLIGRFFIADNAECERDYLQIFDYTNENWVNLTKICGRSPKPQIFNSTSNRMRVLFKTNENTTGDGFQASYDWNCGGSFNVSSKGDLYSPDWPQSYPLNLDCNYTLLASARTIILKTESFELEESTTSCAYDSVQFWTRNRYSSLSSNGIFCGKVVPPILTSVGELKIRFKTDDFISLKGFHFTYGLSYCGGEINKETILSFEDLKINEEDDFRKCVWNISAPEDRIVAIKISELEFFINDCSMEFIAIYDTSNSSSNGTLLGKHCQTISNNPVYFRSLGNKVRIDFVSLQNDVKRQSFNIIISFRYGSKVGCGGDIVLGKSERPILSPDINHDGLYEDNMECTWTMSTSTGSTVLLNFNKLDLKPCKAKPSNSCCDALEVYDGASVNTDLIGKYCGQTLPRAVTSSRNFMTIRFVTDDTEKASGFRVSAVTHQSPCGPPILNATKMLQTLVSPNYPSNYPVSVHCEWHIHGDNEKSLHIHVAEVDMENSTNCSHDRLEVMDDGLLTSQLSDGGFPPAVPIYGPSGWQFQGNSPRFSHRFCGKQRQPMDIYSSIWGQPAIVSIKFFSDGQNVAKGFKLNYSFSGCSRNYTEPQGRINFSQLSENCTMTISSPKNTTITLYFSDFYFPMRQGKCASKLEIFEGGNMTREICGFDTPSPVFSNSNMLLLKLSHSSRTMMPSKIDLTYTSTDKGQGCGGQFFNVFGVFTSPFYPGNVRNVSYCCWEITVPVPNSPKVIFKEFDIGSKSTCLIDYVELFDINAETGSRVKRATYCGGDKPANFVGTGQSVAVCYKTSNHNSGIGFSATFYSTSDRK